MTHPVGAFVTAELAAVADPDRAGPMAAYMKTAMPFFGVSARPRRAIVRSAASAFPPGDVAEYRDQVDTLWALPHREEKYCAIALARTHRSSIAFEQIDLYERLVIEGAWWDFVDEIAVHLVGRVVASDRTRMGPVLETWIDSDDLWLRRTAIICQLGHGQDTDTAMLFDFCTRRAAEREFFIAKAIGWALRQYARTDPDAVRSYVDQHGDELAPLSIREATKHF